jgi:Sulfatase
LSALYPILLAGYAVLFLWSQNLGEARIGDVVPPLVISMAVATAVTWLLGRLLGDRRRGALIVAPIVVGGLMYGHVVNLAKPLHVPGIVQQAAWVALVIVAIVAAIRLGAARLGSIDTLLTRLSAILVAVTLALIVPYQVGTLFEGSTVTAAGPIQTGSTAPKRDVYYIIWDRYGSDRALELRTGFKNDLTPWLDDHGFTTLPDSHANYVRTTLSLATTLNMQPLDKLITPLDPDSRSFRPLDDLLVGPTVPRQFQALGYRYIHIGSWYDATDFDPSADVNYNWDGTSDFLEELYDDSAAPAITARLHLHSVLPTHDEEHFDHGVFELATLDTMVDEPGPKFVFGHVLLPHPPYVFDTDGTPFTADEVAHLSQRERWERQLGYTNAQIRSLVEKLQALPEERRPIIILQADEGPYPAVYSATRDVYDWATASTDELEMKFGILNAWYLPDGQDDLGLYPTMTSINTFPTLFDGYFGLDYPKQPDRIYTSTNWLLPYGLTEVTSRIPTAAAAP